MRREVGRGAAETVGAVLIGGASRRMGRDKASLEFEGRLLAERAVATLRRALQRVCLVGRSGGELPDLGVERVPDRWPGKGPLAGVHAALCYAAPHPVFVLACDLPRVVPELVLHLVSEVGERFEDAPSVRYAALGGRRQPLCGVWSPACREPIEAELAAGRHAVRDFVARVDAKAVELTPELPFYRPDLLVNLNRPRDLPAGTARVTP